MTVSDGASDHVVYLFDGAGTTWLGAAQNKTTDASGVATFTLPTGAYMFATDVASTRYWSTPVPCTVAGCTSATIDLGVTAVNVTVSDGAADHVVYLFNGAGTWLGASYNQTTDGSGVAHFNLSTGDYKFATDMFGNVNYRYWSTPDPCSVPTCTAATIDLGIAAVDVTVSDLAADHVVYLFDGTGTTWLGASENLTTTVGGVAHFNLPTGDYMFATDMFNNPSYRYWSTPVPCTVSGCTAASIDLGITAVTVTVSDGAAGHVVYLFNGAGTTWLGASQNQTTDASGVATFTLPTGDYMFATDVSSIRYWSTPVPCTVASCTAAAIDVTPAPAPPVVPVPPAALPKDRPAPAPGDVPPAS